MDYDRTISPDDHMAFSGEEAYFRVTDSGAECILHGVKSVGLHLTNIRSVLDFGSGYGRVYRALPRMFPSAVCTAMELIAAAARFCAETFGGDYVVSSENLDHVAMPRQYDVVWVGSVFTHLPQHRWVGLMSFLARITSPGGVVVFTVHGEKSLHVFETHILSSMSHVMTESDFRKVQSDLPQKGFCYVPKQAADLAHGVKIGMNITPGEYGFSFNTESWVRGFIQTLPEWELVSHCPAAWANNHDVVTVQRRIKQPQ